jgi:hypothetical protein
MNAAPRHRDLLAAAFDSCLRTIAGAESGKEQIVFGQQSREAMRHAIGAGQDKVDAVDRLHNAGTALGLHPDFLQATLSEAVESLGRPPQLSNGKQYKTAGLSDNPVSHTKFSRTSTNTIMATKYPPLRAIVAGYLYEGFTVLAGRQKLGKTWLGIDWAVAVATGGVAMGSISCDQGDVLYIDMENGPRRIQGRINTLFADERERPDLSRLEWVTEALPLNEGFIGELDRWRLSVEKPTLVVIDVLQRIKPPGSMARNAYENDYSIWAPLQSWATEHGIAVLGLHHTKKGGAEDPLEALSGSNGLSACADTTIVLDQNQNGRTLYVRGRDVEEKETAVIFAAGNWTVLGEASDVRRSDERSVIIEALKDNREPMTPTELAAVLGKQTNNIKQLLFKMAKAGELHRAGKGQYWTEANYPHNSDNRSNRSEVADD